MNDKFSRKIFWVLRLFQQYSFLSGVKKRSIAGVFHFFCVQQRNDTTSFFSAQKAAYGLL